MKYFYAITDEYQDEDDLHEIDSKYHDLQYVAEDCAENYYDEHDGYEIEYCEISITIFQDKDLKTKLADFNVHWEYNPVFRAKRVKV